MHPGSELVHHLFVELPDAPPRCPRFALHEDAEQAAIRDGAATRYGHDASIPAALDRDGDAIPHESWLELGEFVGGVGAGEHAEDTVEDVARKRLVWRSLGDGAEQLVTGPLVHHGHRDDLLSEDIER